MEGFSKYHFKGLDQDEKILHVIHRNWFYMLSQFFLIFLILGLFFGAIMLIPNYFPNLLDGMNESVSLFVENFFVLALWIYGFLIWIDYYFDIWIITDQRIVNVEQKGLFSRQVSELRYNKIEDITTQVIGFVPSVLNYGDLKIQTAATESEFHFRTVSNPYHLKSVIMELQKRAEKSSTDQLGEMLKEKLGE